MIDRKPITDERIRARITQPSDSTAPARALSETERGKVSGPPTESGEFRDSKATAGVLSGRATVAEQVHFWFSVRPFGP